MHAQFRLALATKGTLAGQLTITGLPWIVRGDTQVTGAGVSLSFMNNHNLPAGTIAVTGWGRNGDFQLRFNRLTLTALESLLPADIDDDFVVSGSITYFTDA